MAVGARGAGVGTRVGGMVVGARGAGVGTLVVGTRVFRRAVGERDGARDCANATGTLAMSANEMSSLADGIFDVETFF